MLKVSLYGDEKEIIEDMKELLIKREGIEVEIAESLKNVDKSNILFVIDKIPKLNEDLTINEFFNKIKSIELIAIYNDNGIYCYENGEFGFSFANRDKESTAIKLINFYYTMKNQFDKLV